MPTAKISLSDRQQAIVMGLREALMDYYKGSCIQRLARSDNIVTVGLSEPSHQAYWRIEAWENAQDRPTLLLLYRKPLFAMSTNHLLIYTDNDKLKTVRTAVKQFMDKYLGAISISETDEAPNIDSRLLVDLERQQAYTVNYSAVPNTRRCELSTTPEEIPF